jgi:hypothetical protein
LRWDGRQIFIGTAKHYLAVQTDSENNNFLNVIYRNFCIGKIDLNNNTFFYTSYRRIV